MSEPDLTTGPATRTARAVRRQLGVLLVGGGAFIITDRKSVV